MQMSALLVAILLAGGNPVWDQQKPQLPVCESTIAAAKSGLVAPTQKTRRAPACQTTAKPLAEAAAPATVQAR